MKNHLRILSAVFMVFHLCCSASATRIPDSFEGTITQLNASFVTIKNQQNTKVFNIKKAGICGWPTKKKITDVFKIGDAVIAYYFGDITSKAPVSALNLFYSDEEKVRRFQQGETAQNKLSPKK